MNTQTRRIALAGAILFLGAVATIVAIHIAEALTPNYSTAAETVSGIGSTFFSSISCFVAHCNVMHQPASIIFISLLWILGALFMRVAGILQQASQNSLVYRTLRLIGIDVVLLGVSYLPLYGTPSDVSFNFAFTIHTIAGLLLLSVLPAYLMLSAHKFTRPPFGQVSHFFAAVVLIATPVYIYMCFMEIVAGPGFGGVERILIYTGLTWFAGFGAYLMAAPDVLLMGNATDSR